MMVNRPTPYDAAISDLMAKRAEIDRLIVELEKARAMFAGVEYSAPAVLADLAETDRPYEGMTSVQAAVAHLKKQKPGNTLSPKQLATAIIDGGVDMDETNPGPALNKGLLRRAKSFRDVIRVKRGQWGLREWYSEAEQIAIERRVAEADAHAELTAQGVEKARALGKRIGPQLKFTEPKVVEFKRLRDEGVTITEACRRIGISLGTYQKYKERIEAWHEGEPWPPKNEAPAGEPKGASEAEDESDPTPTDLWS